jgi:hypothetical protein
MYDTSQRGNVTAWSTFEIGKRFVLHKSLEMPHWRRLLIERARRSAPAILDDRRIAFFCFASDVTGEQPRFDYRLRDGVSEQRLA